ncbi:MAG: DUF11 domain-containing protein [Bacteroidetes bacterium]|nr:MAG: DUF11 domain-containing protein [Bacteroidota bacterium]
MNRIAQNIFLFTAWFFFLSMPAARQLNAQPAGFSDQLFVGGWTEAVGMTFDPNGRLYVWEKGGKVWLVENGVKSAAPLIDISEEVGNWRDFGLLGFALDPDFLTNGYFYLCYVVDRHHLLHFGTPAYDPAMNEYFAATIGRVTRYQADAATNFTTIVPGSRQILMGETPSTGMPILHESHGVGALVFGEDGTLLVCMGDGASYSSVDEGSASETYWSQALADGIITAAENVGAYRCQMLSSHNGKIFRIDPQTGDGVASNPFFDAGNPRSAASRTWSLGVRNPYRIAHRPGTGSHQPADGDPGVFYFGDVGWGTWEDLNVISAPGQNFGWPKYEGITFQPGYNNPAFAPATHERPKIDFRHGSTPEARGVLADGSVVNVGSGQLPGTPFNGNASTGGIWYTGTDFPATWQNTYFHADYSQGWIRNFVFDANNNPVEVREFMNNAGPVVHLASNPITGGLYYVKYPDEIRVIKYTGGGNLPPVARASSEVQFGAAPLVADFRGDTSFDPENSQLSYLWDFGDGNTSTAANPVHIFNAANLATFTVTLTVTDDQGLTDQTTLDIFVNNTPPVIVSTSLDNVSGFDPAAGVTLPLNAVVNDAEHPLNTLTFAWQSSLFHNDHHHDEPVDNNPSTSAILSPVACGGATYWYRIQLTVTDPEGLSTTLVKDIFPNCPGTPQTINLAPISDKNIFDAPFPVTASASSGLPVGLYVVEGPATLSGNTISLTGTPGVVTLRATQPGDATYAPAQPAEVSFEVKNAFTGNCGAVGAINREVWTGISGTSVAQIPLNTPPDLEDTRPIFEAPVNVMDNYGTRMRGYICPPQSGNYIFWISSDDNGELWLSTDADPANKLLIATVPSWTNSREWDKFPQQQSVALPLNAGQLYYIEALQKEQGGGDNLAVGWQLPDGSLERPISGSHLSPFNGGMLNQLIDFTPIADKLTTDPPFVLSATASSGLPVVFSVVSGPATVSGNTLTLDGTPGTVIVRASQPGDMSYFPAPAVEQSFVVNQPANTFVGFSDQTALLSNPNNFHSGVAMGVADMNGDGKDDIIRLDNAKDLFIEYQNAPNMAFTTFNFGSLGAQNEWALCIADVDGNGFNDLATGGNANLIKLLKANAGGTNYTTSTLANSDFFVQGANFADINNDGAADLFVCNDDAESRPFENDGAGNLTFNPALISTATVPASDNSGNYASIWTDYDNDGDLDLYISKCRGGVADPTDPRRVNQLFQNDGQNNFTEVAQAAGLALGGQSWTTDFADIDNDGDLDCFVINHDVASQLMRNNGDGTFTDITAQSGMAGDLDFPAIQAIFKDFDNDGWVDLVMAGALQKLFRNNGDGTFTKINAPFSADNMESLAIGDLNHDGFPDIYGGYALIYNTPSTIPDHLWMNQGNANNWLAVQLTGTVSNINGIGARIELYGTWGKQIREVRAGEGYGIMNSFTRFFGLGNATAIDKVVVRWPSGIVNEVLNPAPNQYLNITETPPVGNEADLSLSMSLSPNTPAIWNNFTVTATLTNAGPADATGVVAHFPKPDEVVFQGGNAATVSQGNFDPFVTYDWNVGTLAAGASATIELHFFLLSNNPFFVFGEVTAANEPDPDSTPGNGGCCVANEDDEYAQPVPDAGPQNQTITFPIIPNKETTAPPFDISATASSGLPVSFSIVSGPATISGNTITLSGQTGLVVVRASQAGNAQWNPAPDVERTFNVSAPGLQNQTIAFSNIPDKITTDPPFMLNATASSGLPVSFTLVSGPATLSGSMVTLTGQPGMVTIRASQAGDAQYNPAPDVERTFNVNNPPGLDDIDLELSLATSNPEPGVFSVFTVTTTLTNNSANDAHNVLVEFIKPANTVFTGGNEYQASQGTFNAFGAPVWTVGTLPAGASATLEANLFYLDNNPATSYAQVTAADENDADSSPANGTCCVGAEDDEAALTVPQSGPQNQTITFPAIPDQDADAPPFTISATATSGLPVTFSIDSGPATISGDIITLTGALGTVVVRASQAGDANWNPAPDVTRSFLVVAPGLMNQTITFDPLPNKLTTDPPFALTATASSGLPVSFTLVSGPATLSGNTLTLDGTAGTVVVRASQAGDANWNPAPDVTRSFSVSPPAGANDIDLELSLSADANQLNIWTNVTFTATLTNTGNADATGVVVHLPVSTGMAYTASIPQQGTYDVFFQDWSVGTLPAGQSAQIDLTLFVLQNTTPLDYFIQVTDANESDPDSSPGNGSCCLPAEDDEAAWTLHPPGQAAIGESGDVFSFFAEPEGFKTRLQWTTNMGEGAVRFVVERATDGYDYRPVRTRENEEATPGYFMTYFDADQHPVPGANYYRVKMIRSDSSVLFSNVRRLEFSENIEALTAYPNPANDQINLNLRPLEGAPVQLRLFDLSGQPLRSIWVEKAPATPLGLDVSDLRDGLYLLWIMSESRRPVVLKVVVHRM